MKKIVPLVYYLFLCCYFSGDQDCLSLRELSNASFLYYNLYRQAQQPGKTIREYTLPSPTGRNGTSRSG